MIIHSFAELAVAFFVIVGFVMTLIGAGMSIADYRDTIVHPLSWGGLGLVILGFIISQL